MSYGIKSSDGFIYDNPAKAEAKRRNTIEVFERSATLALREALACAAVADHAGYVANMDIYEERVRNLYALGVEVNYVSQ